LAVSLFTGTELLDYTRIITSFENKRSLYTFNRRGKKVKQSCYKPGVAQRVSGS
jgi:hypothetical protein